MFVFHFGWVFVALHELSLVAASGGKSLAAVHVFLMWWLLLLQGIGSRHAHFSSRSTWAQQLQYVGSKVHEL